MQYNAIYWSNVLIVCMYCTKQYCYTLILALVGSCGTRIIIKEFTDTFSECNVGLWDIAGCTGG